MRDTVDTLINLLYFHGSALKPSSDGGPAFQPDLIFSDTSDEFSLFNDQDEPVFAL